MGPLTPGSSALDSGSTQAVQVGVRLRCSRKADSRLEQRQGAFRPCKDVGVDSGD